MYGTAASAGAAQFGVRSSPVRRVGALSPPPSVLGLWFRL